MSKLQHPEVIVLNGERYAIARDKKGARLWREATVPVQPGGGEKQVTFDTWHLGMGHSRLKQPGTYEYALGINATHPNKITIGPEDGTLAAASGHTFYRLIEYQGYIYALGVTTADNDIYYVRINSSGAIAAQGEAETNHGGPPGQCAVWENELYIPVTANTSLKVSSGALDTYVAGNACDALHFCRVGRDLWGVPLGDKGKISKLPAGTSWTWGTNDTAPGDGTTWGALYGVGDTGQGINSLHEWGRWLYVGKPDGLFGGDTDANQWNQIPEVIESSSNCLRLAKWQGMLWAPSILGLYRHTGLSSRTQGPEVLTTNASFVRGGYFTALAKAGHWIYGAFKAQNNWTYLLTGRLREPNEPGAGEVIWHGAIGRFTTSYTVSDMLVSTITTPPRLWMTFSAGVVANYLYYFILNKDGSINPADSGYRSDIGGTPYLYSPRIDLDSPGTPKAGHFIEVHTSGTLEADDKKYVRMDADWDGGGFNQVGANIDAVGTTFTRLFWTAGTNDTGRSLQLRTQMVSDANDARPVVERITVNLIESPRREPAIRCSVRLADRLDKKRSLTQMKTDIEALLSGKTYTLTDPDDPAAGTMKVIVHDYEYVEREQVGTKQAEKQCDLTLRVVEYS